MKRQLPLNNTKNLLTVALIATASLSAQAQDTIITKTDQHILGKIEKVGTKYVKYRALGDKRTITAIYTKDVAIIGYHNGKRNVLGSVIVDDEDEEGRWDKRSASEIAEDVFSGKHSYSAAEIGTFAVAAVGSPVLGLIPGFLCSSAKLIDPKLNALKDKAMESKEMKDAYEKQAKKVRSKKIWKAYLAGSAVYAAWFSVFIVLRH